MTDHRRSEDDRGDAEGYVIGPTSGGPDVEVRRQRRAVLHADDWIQAQVRRRLEASSLAGSPVEIDVHHGDVTLRGRVSGPAARHLAEQIASSITGVRAVRNELAIGSAHGERPGVPDA